MTSALDGSEWPESRPGRASPCGQRTHYTHWIGGWVIPRAGLDTGVRGKILLPLPGIEHRLPCLKLKQDINTRKIPPSV
jgi:hypothetical protein